MSARKRPIELPPEAVAEFRLSSPAVPQSYAHFLKGIRLTIAATYPLEDEFEDLQPYDKKRIIGRIALAAREHVGYRASTLAGYRRIACLCIAYGAPWSVAKHATREDILACREELRRRGLPVNDRNLEHAWQLRNPDLGNDRHRHDRLRKHLRDTISDMPLDDRARYLRDLARDDSVMYDLRRLAKGWLLKLGTFECADPKFLDTLRRALENHRDQAADEEESRQARWMARWAGDAIRVADIASEPATQP